MLVAWHSAITFFFFYKYELLLQLKHLLGDLDDAVIELPNRWWAGDCLQWTWWDWITWSMSCMSKHGPKQPALGIPPWIRVWPVWPSGNSTSLWFSNGQGSNIFLIICYIFSDRDRINFLYSCLYGTVLDFWLK